MKFKISQWAYEAVTYVVNLMVREILIYTCNQCASQKTKLTKVSHIPWEALQTKLLAGLYMNTKAVFTQLHPSSESETPTTANKSEEEEVVVSEEEVVGNDDATPVKTPKPRLAQFISTTFKEIVSHDERFHGLLLGRETANSKTVNKRLAIIATKILLQDHVHSVDADVTVVLDVLQARLDELKSSPEPEEDNSDETDETP
ncbi:hypothetical protein PPTG_04423 [Phytophthora nicotianae INRA-310]|uniref:Uncharacterized protein n=1 Tax=Phytophthora nicotianae (strain INRA-310) TaxID=761204 RepID=W2R153_PHYN3|nr:hypothetical protein PPTG_04423 [Phytophthora nicotianae INRA-310]ETN18991.1 hypothetical protein PPTG_04423 [Phytophthora nicotianae INRA-310]